MSWDLVSRVAPPILAAVVGWWLKERLERRSKLITYIVHAAGVPYPGATPDAPRQMAGMHSVVISNAGKKAATNVRLSHNFLPAYSLWPRVQHRIEPVPDSGPDIVIPTLAPGELVTASYLYTAPATFRDVSGRVRSDEGLAREVTALPVAQRPRWLVRMLEALVLVGAATILYLAVLALRAACIGLTLCSV